jgi:multidrug efflux pump subunit AcrA (membrane-fusion protein)
MRNIKKHYIWLTIIGLILLLIGSKVFVGNRNNNTDTLILVPQKFTRTVSVSGKVIPADDVLLGFEISGRVAGIYKKEGDKVYAGETLVILASGDASADVLQARADIAAENAKLAELKKNTTEKLEEAISDAYTRSDDAVRNNVDQFYNDGKISFAFNDYDLKQELNVSRKSIERLLDKWKDDQTLETSEVNLTQVKYFLERVALAVNDFQSLAGQYTQTEINKFKSDISSARASIASAISNLIDAKESVRNNESQIPYQEAKISSAEARLASLQSVLGKRVITAPFTGVVTNIDVQVGEIVGANIPVMRLISDKTYIIETYVPELNISEIQVGNLARVTLDAYRENEIFEAKIISVDPGETIKDGVSTYKVTFEFIREDTRLKSGMTANVIITTETRKDTILIPQEAIIKRNGFSYVNVMVSKEKIEKQVTVGAIASNGFVEIISGLSAGEVVVKNAQ